MRCKFRSYSAPYWFRSETMISGGSSYHHDLPHDSQQYVRLAKHHDWSTPENIPFQKFSKSQKKMNTPLTDLPFFYLFANNINAHTAAEQVSSLTLPPAIRGDIGNLWTLLLLCTCKFPEYHDKLVDVLGLCSEVLDVLPKKELLANPLEIYLPAAAPWIETLAVQMHY
ncbi:hypothetical protein BDV24DRAFT_134109 [Aspergillus arachidicola]|uniref:Uncharacterized protein n=1 Tax=Aspergillus arachidicola TaxID=656916 RepID=A0A5N6Y4A6_9EURO|nr:hypothetical protein BDV24DRAFT_134109 [Aspergillus arachidicola]